MTEGTTKLAVLGSPIAHSRSPQLHAAAYRVLGLDWEYGMADVAPGSLGEFVESLGPEWRGLSLTMPLKREVLPLLDAADDLVALTGGANTVLFDRSIGGLVVRGFNTDVVGVVNAFRGSDVESVDSAWIFGAGATAASTIVALSRLGASEVVVLVRELAKAKYLVELGGSVGVQVAIATLSESHARAEIPDVVVSTLPGSAGERVRVSPEVRSAATLLDVAYDPWPSALANAWTQSGGTVVSGLEMLLQQAVAQVRIFVSGSASVELPREALVIAAMRESLTA